MKRLFWVAVGAVGATSGTRWVKRKAADAAEQYRPVEVGLRTAKGMAARVDAARRDGRSAREETEQRLRGRLLGADVDLVEGEAGAVAALAPGEDTLTVAAVPLLDDDPAAVPAAGPSTDLGGAHGAAGARRRRRLARRR